MAEKTAAEKLKEALLYQPKNGGATLSDDQLKAAFDFCERYKAFMDRAKTEREAVEVLVRTLEGEGFSAYEPGRKYLPGDKLYYNNRGKALIGVVMGKKGLEEGVRMVASHIDSPRLDLKPRPLYEEAQLALFKTHYYGGIKKYQWTSIPLSLHGVIYKKDGSQVSVCVGEAEGDPVFCVTDLLPHLADAQRKRTLEEGIKGEELNILVGSLPFRDDKESELVKLNIMRLLHEKYGIVEADFISAELEAVPAYKSRDIGFDRSMLGAYGHDDRVCAYTSLMAALCCNEPEYTTVTVFADKEETGSNSNTGMDTAFLRYFIADLAQPHGVEGRRVIARSKCLSADVNAGFDPTYPDVLEKNNAAYMGYGVALAKYTGSGGKYGTSDATAEFVSEVTRLLDEKEVKWQIGELGKVDQGGGGTVAVFLAALDMDVLDVGVPVLSMHAPFEIVSKIDVYMAYKAFCAFYGERDGDAV